MLKSKGMLCVFGVAILTASMLASCGKPKNDNHANVGRAGEEVSKAFSELSKQLDNGDLYNTLESLDQEFKDNMSKNGVNK